MLANAYNREFQFDDPSLKSFQLKEDGSGTSVGGVGSTVWDAALVLVKWLELRLKEENDPQTNQRSLCTWKNKWSREFRLSTQRLMEPKPLNFLELGAGTGVVGIALACLLPHANVIVTDRMISLPLLLENVNTAIQSHQLAPCQLRAQRLDFYDALKEPCRDPKPSSLKTRESGQNPREMVMPYEFSTPVDVILFSDLLWWKELHQPLIATLIKITDLFPKAFVIFSYESRDFDNEVSYFKAFSEKFTFFNVPMDEMHPQWSAEDISIFICQRKGQPLLNNTQ
jgi:predicted nicotinamide N-methyase